MERKYYEDIGYKPFLFYVVFGVSANELEISREKHKVDEIPEGLDVIALSRPEHSDYLDGLLGGDIGKVLKNANSDLYETCVKTEKVVILKGEIQKDSTFDYMRNVIGIIQAFIDKGAAGVLDLMTFTLYSTSEWNKRFFAQDEVNAQLQLIRQEQIIIRISFVDGYGDVLGIDHDCCSAFGGERGDSALHFFLEFCGIVRHINPLWHQPEGFLPVCNPERVVGQGLNIEISITKRDGFRISGRNRGERHGSHDELAETKGAVHDCFELQHRF